MCTAAVTVKKQIIPLAPCSEPAEFHSLAQAPGVKEKQMPVLEGPFFPLLPFCLGLLVQQDLSCSSIEMQPTHKEIHTLIVF